MKTLIIIPAFNEEANIVWVVNRLVSTCPDKDYIVVNDGSRDATAELCRQNGFHLLDLPTNLGLAGAFQAGLRYAQEYGYDCAIQFDADGQHLPEYIAKLEEKMAQGSDVVIASRFYEKKKPKTLRMLGSSLIQLSMQLTVHQKLTDPTSGMRAYNAKMIDKLARGNNLGPEPDTLAWLIRGGAKIEEIQAEMHERIAGESYLNLSVSIRYMIRIGMSILLFQWFRPL